MIDRISEHWFVDPTRPTQAERQRFLSMGLSVDDLGRPMHPWMDILDANQRIAGKGEFYEWGPNYTADAIVFTEEDIPSVLLVKRQDTGQWALPGGFRDEGESDLHAAIRELGEETSLTVESSWTKCYSGPVADPRTTRHAWPETTAYFTHVDAPSPVKPSDEVVQCEWFRLDELCMLDLYGSHQSLIEAGLRAADAIALEASRNLVH